MKLLKGIIKAVFILIFVLVVAVVVFLLVISDNSTPDYKPSEELTTLDGLLGKGIYESLDKVALIQKEDRPTSENNKIDFSFTYQNINDCVTDIIRTNESINNPTYLMTDGTDKILQNGVVSLNSIEFKEINHNVGVVARGSAFGFYNTTITLGLEEAPSIVDNVLYLKLGELKLGNKMSISKDFVKGFFNRFSLFKDSKNDIFDVENLTLKLDLNQQIEKFSGTNRFKDFFGGATFTTSYTEGENAHFDLSMETKNIFINYDIPTPQIFELDPMAILALTDKTIELSEENFNYIIQHKFDAESYNLDPLTLGGYEFKFGLNNLYFDVNASLLNSNILAEVSINNLKTLLKASVKETVIKESNYVKEVKFNVENFTLGKTEVANDNFFDEIVIDEDTLTQGHSDIIKVENVVFDHDNGKVKITYAPAI
ncbi:MAG: hypothetical protein SPJ17_00705 [Anaeroplasma sp.]|uniref:hypothetical protein n=1 Tax=Anaeroplasma sp. TaxID=1872523 RepID=UPI002A90CCC2|nr:hypothetical protein [Anaeroplasma sp.]MDY5982209.1 hypothetical protein [Anaeroplasma sp.]